MQNTDIEVVTTADRPDLVSVVATWLWDEFWRRNGHSFAATVAAVQASVTTAGLPRSFVLLCHGKPVGTASLAAQDLDERPALSPWLAGVVIDAAWRGRGLVQPLIRAVEDAARLDGFHKLWLYTYDSEAIYSKAGWRRAELVGHRGRDVVLMRRDLDQVADQPRHQA